MAIKTGAAGSARIDQRRRLLLGGIAATTFAPLWGCGGGGDDLVADTSSGRFVGQVDGTVVTYLGIPYAQPPVGALRFRAPQPVQAQAGIVDATGFGPASLQTISPSVGWIYPQQDQQSEDCLTLNVWTPDPHGRLPVIVWFHGGGFRTGATRMPLMNGRALAELGVVVVTVNYRLGMLGLLSHPDFADPTNGTSANWQLQDMGAALQWVQRNIGAFGGDANKVTVMGQSGGAMHTAILAQNPTYRSTFQRAILVSPPTLTAPASMSLADAATYTEALAISLGTTPLGLRDLPAKTVFDAELALNSQPLPSGLHSGFAFRMAPIIDGASYLNDWTRGAWPQDMPVLITYTLTEGAFWYDLYDPLAGSVVTPPPPSTSPALSAALLPQVGGSTAAAAVVIDAYTRAATADGRSTAAADLWVEIFGDRLLRNFGTRYAASAAGAGANVRLATYMHPLLAPARGVPHCADIPMIFGTYSLDYYKTKVGASAVEAQLSQSMMSSIVSFARDAQPRLSSGAAWPTYLPGTATSVRWGENGTADEVLAQVPKLDQMKVWDSILGY